MKTKNILLIVFTIVLLFPLYAVLQIFQLETTATAEEATSTVNFLQISIWISWVFMVSMAIYYKWVQQSNFFFVITYIFVIAAFGFFGFLLDDVINKYGIGSRLGDQYPVAIYTFIRNVVASIAFTVFLQLAVFWFTRKWHRK